jgi:5-methyltetrahydrofolate--homocysteine methyltransferase
MTGRFDFSDFDFSEGFERLRNGFLGDTADHVPFIQQSHEFNMAYSGIDAREYYSDPEAINYGAFLTAQEVGFEIPDGIWDCYNIEAEALGVPVVWFDDMIPALNNTTALVTCEADLAKLPKLIPGQSGRMGFAYDATALYAELLNIDPCLGCCSPFSLATQIMTFEGVVLGMKDDPALIHKIMTYIVEDVLAPYINEFASRYPNATADCADAVASLPFISQQMSEEFALGYMMKLRELTDGRATCCNWWGDSYLNDEDQQRFWQNKLLISPDWLKVQDPDLHKIGIQKAKDFTVETGTSLIAGLSNNLLQDGPIEDIEQRIHEYLEVIEPGGHSVLYLCNFGPQTPIEHVKTAVQAINAYRKGDRPWSGERRSGTAASVSNFSESVEASRKVHTSTEENEILLDDIFNDVIDGLEEDCVNHVREALDKDIPLTSILDDALISAMDEVGSMFSDGTIFVPEMLLSARAMKQGLELLRPLLSAAKTKPKGLAMLVTVQGDVHDIGKNLVGMMLEGAGFDVIDIGVNVSPENAVAKAQELKPDIVCLSALLTTTMPSMGKIINAFRDADMPQPIIVGGAPVSQEFADSVNADGYADNAPDAVVLAKRIVASSSNWRQKNL